MYWPHTTAQARHADERHIATRNASHVNLLRQLGSHERARVGLIELFFDRVFAFAITRLAHTEAETILVRRLMLRASA